MDNRAGRFARRRRSVYWLFATVCSLALAGCGDGGNGSTPPPSPGLTANNGCAYVGLNEPLTATLSGTDPEGRALTYEILDSPSSGNLTLTNPLTGEFNYTPNTNARGTDSFTFRVNNGRKNSAPATQQLIYTPRILPLGDSITAGITAGNDPPPSDRIGYRKKLYDDLTAADFEVDFVGSQTSGAAAGVGDPDHEGHPGWCDDNVPSCTVSGGATIDGSVLGILNDERPDVILLHIGTNHFNVSAAGVNSILDKISAWGQSNATVSVFLARIIPSMNGLDVTTFNDNVQSIAGDRPGARVFIVDQQAELRSAGDPNLANAALMADELHPNQAGYDRMAERWRDRIIASGVLPRCP